MELATTLCASVALILSLIAFGFTIWNTIEIQAQKRATHTVIPISPQTTTLSNIEDELDKIVKGAGGNQNDLNRNMSNMGLDPDDLV